MPAVGGVLAGTWLQQRVPPRTVSLLFAVLLTAVAVELLLHDRRVLLIGVAAGMLAGMLGVGGGALFVPALVLIVGLSQVEAEATSLLAIVPVALVGAWQPAPLRQPAPARGAPARRCWRSPGRSLGVVVVNAVPERAVEVAFAVLLLYVAWTLARRGLRSGAGVEPAERGAAPPYRR